MADNTPSPENTAAADFDQSFGKLVSDRADTPTNTQPDKAAPAATATDDAADDEPEAPSLLDVLKGKRTAAADDDGDDDSQGDDNDDADASDDDHDAGEDPEAPADLSEKGKSSWQKLKAKHAAEREQLTAQLKEHQTQLQKFKQLAGDRDLEQILAEHKEMSERLAVENVKATPFYRREFAEPMKASLEKMKQIFADNKLKPEAVDELLSLEGKEFRDKVSDVLDDFKRLDGQEFMDALKGYQTLKQKEAALQQQSGNLSQALRQQAEKQQKQTLEKVWREVSSENAFLSPIEAGDKASDEERQEAESYNAALQQIQLQGAEIALNPKSEADISKAAYKAATLDFFMQHAMPRIEKQYVAITKQLAQMTKENKALRAARPGAGGGSNQRGQAGAPSIQGKSFDEAFAVMAEAKR